MEQIDDTAEDDDEIGDDFENLYKGEISKSGIPILPSKRARRIPEKIQVSQEDLAELKNSDKDQSIAAAPTEESSEDQDKEVSLDKLKEEAVSSEEAENDSTNN